MIRSIVQSFRILKKVQPDIVCGFGGYGAFPVVFAANILRIPTIIHEQNVVPGKANRLLVPFVKKIAISFRQTHIYLRPHNIVYTGCPSHIPNGSYTREKFLADFKLTSDRKTVLVIGGSQGSQSINEVVLKMLPDLDQQQRVQIIHITGQEDYAMVSDAYKQMNIPHVTFSYMTEIERAYQAADIVISRSGAVTVFELATFRKPAVLIPYPHASNHQRKNAEVLAHTGFATILDQKDLNAHSLRESVLELIENINTASFNERTLLESFELHAAQRLAKEILWLA
jgi:UDP-N-acetylglucosamine--N-acetylmuramyl-(pentapeptide) pyrophosphoryl-undecaprenol N-acetylglucosamine transferase